MHPCVCQRRCARVDCLLRGTCAGERLDGSLLDLHAEVVESMFTVRGVGRREDLALGVRCAAGVLLQAALRLEQVRAVRPQGCPSAAELAGSFGCCAQTGSS